VVKRARSTISTVEPYRQIVERWAGQKVSGVAIHAALCRHRAAAVCPWGGRAGRLWRRPRPGGLGRGDRPTQLVLRDDAASVRGIRVRSDGGQLARLPSSSLRVVRRRARAADHRQSQVRDYARLHLRPIGPARLRRVRRGLRLQDRSASPRDPAKKGIVEAGVKYVKRNFLPIRQFRDLSDVNAQARRWVMDEAGQRVHGTTREQPLSRFERPPMRALPEPAPDLGTWVQVAVHRDCHVQFGRML
jgi:hypothetical protein